MLYCTCIKSLYHFVSTKDLGIHHLGVLGQCANEHCSLKDRHLETIQFAAQALPIIGRACAAN